MKYLGIDYGTKRTGLAIAEGSVAFPLRVMDTTDKLANDIADIVATENIEKIIIGESKNAQGVDNAIMDNVRDLIGQLSLLVQVPIDMQREDFSTSAVRQPMVAEKNVARSRAKRPVGDNDTRAAALILQRYIDKQGA